MTHSFSEHLWASYSVSLVSSSLNPLNEGLNEAVSCLRHFPALYESMILCAVKFKVYIIQMAYEAQWRRTERQDRADWASDTFPQRDIYLGCLSTAWCGYQLCSLRNSVSSWSVWVRSGPSQHKVVTRSRRLMHSFTIRNWLTLSYYYLSPYPVGLSQDCLIVWGFQGSMNSGKGYGHPGFVRFLGSDSYRPSCIRLYLSEVWLFEPTWWRVASLLLILSPTFVFFFIAI